MTLTIHEVSAALNQWRKQTKRGRIPSALKNRIISLCEQYSVKHISQELKLRETMLECWIQKCDLSATETEFVTLTSLTESSTTNSLPAAISNSANLNISLLLPNGIQLLLGQPTTRELANLVSSLLREGN